MSSRTNSLFATWLPVVLWLGLIAFESTSMMSAGNTGTILDRILKLFFGPLPPHQLDVINFAARKLGHFTGYGILGLLFFRAIRRTIADRTESASTSTAEPSVPAASTAPIFFGLSRRLLTRAATTAVICTALVAALDEWHQTLLPSRTGAFHDVVLDTAGAIILLLLVMLRYSRIARTSEAK